MSNIILLHRDLTNKTYAHSSYKAFTISDPKPRNIHKASVRDRLLHHAIYRILYPFFDNTFISDSFSCRKQKGTHKALNRFREFGYIASKNNTRNCWILKCDVRKFFASVNHAILLGIIREYIPDQDIVELISKIVSSFYSIRQGTGLPLGNLTSQLFANIYMNELDQFMKHRVKAKYYIRYADDFAILSEDKEWLEYVLPAIQDFLFSRLRLELHPDKVFIKTLSSGVDFLGWVHFPDHRVLRTATKKRMMRRIERQQGKPETIQSYLGLLSHGNAKKLQRIIKSYMQ